MIFAGGSVFCQQYTRLINKTTRVDTIHIQNCWGNKFQKYYKKSAKDSVCTNTINVPFSFIPSNYYSAHLGFFCKQEIKMEKVTRVPFKFRLGSVQQCDWLEGKINTR
jgi:hypothetical protein